MRDWFRRIIPGQSDEQSERGTQSDARSSAALAFAEIEGTLALYVTALSHGTLRIMSTGSASGGSYTDGRTIFVPAEINEFADREAARSLYRVMAAWKVLQVRTGSLDLRSLPDSANPSAALAFYEALHGEWLDRQMVAIWPGLAPELIRLRSDALSRRQSDGSHNGQPAEDLLRGCLALPLDRLPQEIDFNGHGNFFTGSLLDRVQASLEASDPGASRHLALDLASRFTDTSNGHAPPAVHYRGRIRFDLVRHWQPDADESAGSGRGEKAPEPQRSNAPLIVETRAPKPRIAPDRRSGRRGGRQAVQLSLGDREPTVTAKQVPLTDDEKAGAHLYDEWDYRHDDYHREWCAVWPRHPRSGNTEPVEKILRQNAPLVRQLKQQFEALRPERQRLNRQHDGDDLDLSSIVEAHADRRAGFSPTEKLYSHVLERERNIALGCLIDLSGSTGAWINDDPRNDQVIEVTRRALVFLCEALTMLDDRYAIFGFTSSTRKRCDISIVKGFDETYGETVKGRIAGVAPGAYTRIGPAVRHTTQTLIRQPARLRLLLLISDGRPNDFDGYGSRYGIEDTRKALIEARQSGVATFALTIDTEARDYMPYMFGPNHYVLVENVPALATRLADVYRRLTFQ